MVRLFFVFVFAGALMGCAPIQHQTRAEQPVGKLLIAGPGDTVLKINKFRNLENAVGRSDLFGRKTREGDITLVFLGLEDNKVVLMRRETNIVSNETTMTRSGVYRTSGSSRTTVSNNRASTTYNQTTLAPTSAYYKLIPQGAVAILLAPGESLPVGGKIFTIQEATANMIKYEIREP